MPLTCSCGDWVDAEEWHFGAEGDYYKKMPNLLMAAIYGPNWREDSETEPQDSFLCVWRARQRTLPPKTIQWMPYKNKSATEPVWLVSHPAGRQSKDQKTYETIVTQHGFAYIVCRDIEHFKKIIDEVIHGTRNQ